MANFDEHITQYNTNLCFLEKINKEGDDFLDWQVTACFYTAVHLINAHLAKNDLHFRDHKDVENAINPYTQLSVTKVNEDIYVKYRELRDYSRISRYLLNPKDKTSNKAFYTSNKHLDNSFICLDKILQFISGKYKITNHKIKIKCSSLNQKDVKNIVIM